MASNLDYEGTEEHSVGFFGFSFWGYISGYDLFPSSLLTLALHILPFLHFSLFASKRVSLVLFLVFFSFFLYFLHHRWLLYRR